MKKRLSLFLAVLVFLFLAVLLVIFPHEAKSGAANGIALCSSVIIPSLFPFTFCALMILKLTNIKGLHTPNRIIKKLFRTDLTVFSVFIISLFSGYPTGAALVRELEESGQIARKTAKAMYCCCVNAGPAFIISFISETVFNNNKLGLILLASHILPSFLLLLLYRPLLCEALSTADTKQPQSFSETFVECAAQSSSSMLKICSIVILFSSINGLLLHFSELKVVSMLLEITSGVLLTDNVYAVSFLLGFAGLSVWCQVFANAAGSIHIPLFAASRIIHGTVSAVLTIIFIKVFGITVSTLSNGKNALFTPLADSLAVSIGLFCMTVLFIISVFGKSNCRKMKCDVV